MFAMLAQLFNTLRILFHAGENFAQSLDNVSEVTVIKSQQYKDEAAITAKAEVAAMLEHHAPKP
jgi:hypothetical protein